MRGHELGLSRSGYVDGTLAAVEKFLCKFN